MFIDTSSVSLRLPPSAPVSATPTAFAPQIGQFPTGEGSSTSFVQGVTLFNTALLDERLPKAQFNFVLGKIKHFASLLLRVAKRREGNE